jgi:hypothetical protein
MRLDIKKNFGQSVFEYFILTIIVVSVALFFLKNKGYQQINNATSGAFNEAVDKITVDSPSSPATSSSPAAASSAEAAASAQNQTADIDPVDASNEQVATKIDEIADQLDIEGLKGALNNNSESVSNGTD